MSTNISSLSLAYQNIHVTSAEFQELPSSVLANQHNKATSRLLIAKVAIKEN